MDARRPVTLAVCPPELFPPLATLALARRADVFVAGDTFAYARGARANRMRLRTPDGWSWATAPLDGARAGAPLAETRLAPTAAWATRLARMLRFNYGRAPYYEHYIPEVDALLHAPHGSAAAFALASAALAFGWFGLAAPVPASSLAGVPSTLAAIVAERGAGRLLSLPATHAHDAAVAPADALAWSEPAYRQAFPGFVAGLSCLDALFNRGPHARDLIA